LEAKHVNVRTWLTMSLLLSRGTPNISASLSFQMLPLRLPMSSSDRYGYCSAVRQAPAGRAIADGERPRAGGWNRIRLIVDDLAGEVARLRAAGVQFRNDIVTGPDGSQILMRDPSGNLVGLFQPARR
jgi:predicted enzyme related to lactoylglutathione lyase